MASDATQPEAGSEGRRGQTPPDSVQRLLGQLETALLVHELVAGWRAGLLEAVLAGPGTAAEIAARAGTHERSTREWLALLLAAGHLSHADGVFQPAPDLAAALQPDRIGIDMTVLFEMVELWPRLMPRLARSLRDGSGIPYHAYQPEFTPAMDRVNRPLYDRYLVDDWVASAAGLPERLAAGIDVAEMGCGGALALCVLAATWPRSRFVGYELDETALRIGRQRVRNQHLGNVRLERRDITQLGAQSAFDAIFAIDTVHDLPDPQAALAGFARALRPAGVLLLVEATATGDLDTDTARPGAVLRYASSLGHCLQVSLAAGGQGTGNQWGRPAVLAALDRAGFAQVTPYDSPAGVTVYTART